MSRILPFGSDSAIVPVTRVVAARDRSTVVGGSVRPVTPVLAAGAILPQYANRPDAIDASFVDIGPSSDVTFLGRLSVAEAYARVMAPLALTKGRTADFYV